MSGSEGTFIKASDGYIDRYLFISYAHVDKAKVEGILNILARRGFRIWYDQGGAGIPAGEKWYPAIIERINKSSSFLAFISNATEHRPVVIDEISRALIKKREDPNYKVVFVFLERVSPEGFPDDIRRDMQANQFIDFKKRGGITKEFIELLCDVKWPEAIIDQEYRKNHGMEPWSPDTSENIELLDSISWFSAGSPYAERVGELITAESGQDGVSFYAISPDQLNPNTVYPAVMDNQWVPEEFYNSEALYKEGVRGPTVAPLIIARQRQEILRGLVHNKQIIVNRASILNSKVFSDWYDPGNAEYKDFLDLLDKAAVLLYLYKEKSPVDFPKDFHIPEENKQAWLKTCRDVKVCCLRLDWESEDSNTYETDLMGYAFKNFCLSFADDEYMLNYFERTFQIPQNGGNGRNHTAFLDLWKRVQTDVFEYRDEENKAGRKGTYRRERFYKKFLICAEKTSVDDGILDREKHLFVKELKQIIDFYYSMNLPSALGIQLLPPSDSPLALNMFTSDNSVRYLREIEVDELLFSVSEFKSAFIVNSVCLPESRLFSLGNVARLRDLREWREYMRTISEGKKRANLDHLDLYATKKVWDKHTGFLSAAKSLFPDKEWRERPAAISIIYYFENIELVTVYTGDRVKYRITTSVSDVNRMLNRKSMLRVDYSCCDALTSDRNNLLVTDLRLFEGITHTVGSAAYSALINRCKELGFIEEKELK